MLRPNVTCMRTHHTIVGIHIKESIIQPLFGTERVQVMAA